MSATGEPTGMKTRLECVIPILSVKSLPASVDYYINVLGFKTDWSDDTAAAQVSRDGFPIMLCQGEQGNPGTWVWIGVDGDIDALCQACRSSGATIRQEPTNHEWAYEMRVEDPDGHVLRFGTEPKADEPYSD
jgi:predicted lactoylglutathione lyase